MPDASSTKRWHKYQFIDVAGGQCKYEEFQ